MIGAYKKLHSLEYGSFGSHWLVEDNNTKQYVINLIPTNTITTQELINLIEIRKTLKSANLAEYFNWFEHESYYAIVTEYCAGYLFK